MDYWTRKAQLQHGDISDIAKKCGVSISLVTAVLRGTRTNRRVRVEIARRIGKPVLAVFHDSNAA